MWKISKFSHFYIKLLSIFHLILLYYELQINTVMDWNDIIIRTCAFFMVSTLGTTLPVKCDEVTAIDRLVGLIQRHLFF